MPGNLIIPNTFGTQSGNVAASQIDSDFSTTASYVNAREITLGTLAARPAAGTAGRWYFATDSLGGQLFEDNGSAWTAITTGINPPFVPVGSSVITRTDATHIALGVGVIPLKVSSVWGQRAITAAVSVDTTGLSASTIYYVYATNSSGSTVLELSTTTHAVDTDFGVEIKSGDATRTYVGVVKTDGSTQFTADLTNPWFGAPKLWSLSSAGSGTTSGSYTDVTSSSITVLPHGTASKFKVNFSAACSITNTAGQNNGISARLVDNGSAVTNSIRSFSAVSGAGGQGAAGGAAWTYLSAPAVATAVIYKLQHKSDNTGSTPTATTSEILAYAVEVR
jgi:hypothetical protein